MLLLLKVWVLRLAHYLNKLELIDWQIKLHFSFNTFLPKILEMGFLPIPCNNVFPMLCERALWNDKNMKITAPCQGVIIPGNNFVLIQVILSCFLLCKVIDFALNESPPQITQNGLLGHLRPICPQSHPWFKKKAHNLPALIYHGLFSVSYAINFLASAIHIMPADSLHKLSSLWPTIFFPLLLLPSGAAVPCLSLSIDCHFLGNLNWKHTTFLSCSLIPPSFCQFLIYIQSRHI